MEKSLNFNRAADYYDATRGFPLGVDKDIASFMQQEASLTTTMSILEVGIGTGRIALPLAPHVAFTTGVDISGDMLRILELKRQDEVLSPVEADGLNLPYASNIFDFAVVVHVLHLVSHPKRVLEEIKRTLKPEGCLLHCFTNHDAKDPSPMMQAWNTTRPPRQSSDRLDTAQTMLNSSEWTIEKDVSFWYIIHETPQHYFDMVGKRAWSSTWDISDDELELGLGAMRQVLEDLYNGDMDTPLERRQSYQMQVCRPPA
jgi:ubiquinone/menaquinone biosynthesis C-methylase UbiE